MRLRLAAALIAMLLLAAPVLASEFDVVYQVTLDLTWSEQTHPQDWPQLPHTSPLVGGAHWSPATMASPRAQRGRAATGCRGATITPVREHNGP